MPDDRDSPEPVLDPGAIAAFLEGRADDEERRKVMALMARSRDAREVVAEAAGILAQGAQAGVEEARRDEEAGHPPQRLPWWRRARVALPLAASVALATAVSWPLIRQQTSLSSADVPRLLPATAGAMGEPTHPPVTWSRSRGGPEATEYDALAFRAGYRLADLARAVAVGDTVTSRGISGEISAGLRSAELSGPARTVLRSLATGAAASDPAERARLLDLADREIESALGEDWVVLGRWTAAAVAAASAGTGVSEAFFRRRSVRGTLETLRNRTWPPDVASALTHVGEVLGAPGALDSAALVQALDTLAAVGGR